jgi:hypothetical protein
MDKFDVMKIESVESENISNISDYQINYESHICTLESLSTSVASLQKFCQKYIMNQNQSIQNKINFYFNEINSILEVFYKENKEIINQYESSLKKNEERIRELFSDIFNLKIKNNFLENNVDILLKKECEYQLLKEKTGIIVENGTIVLNGRKENEIFILRKENSNLKNVISKNENEMKQIKEKYKYLKDNYDKKINNLNHKLNQLKFKLRQRNEKTKIQSSCSMNMNQSNFTTSNLKLNFTINNSNNSNKGNSNSNALTNCTNNNINNINLKDINYNNSKKKFNSVLLNQQQEKKIKKRNINYNDQKNLNHYQSSGHLNLKNAIKNKLKKMKPYETSRISNNTGLNLSNLNISAVQSKKLLCLTPKTNGNIRETFQKISEIKNKNKKIKVLNKNMNILKNYSSNQNININNNYNEIKIIYRQKPKNRITQNNSNANQGQQKLKNELTTSQKQLINNSIIPNSPSKINKLMIKSQNKRSHKIIKNLNKINISKTSDITKNVNHNINKSTKNSPTNNKFSLTSIRRKNTGNSFIHN